MPEAAVQTPAIKGLTLCVCVCVCVCAREGAGMGKGREEEWSRSVGSSETPPPQQVRDNQGHQERPRSQGPSPTVLTAALEEREVPQVTGGETRPEAARVSGGGVSPFPG